MGISPPDEAKRAPARFLVVAARAAPMDRPTRGSETWRRAARATAGKVAVVDEVRERLGSAAAAILTEYRGIVGEGPPGSCGVRSPPPAASTRSTRTPSSAGPRTTTGLDVLEPMLAGPTAIAFVDRRRRRGREGAARLRPHEPEPRREGRPRRRRTSSTPRRAAALADLPSARCCSPRSPALLAAPLQRFAGLLQAVPQKFAYALKALIETQRRASRRWRPMSKRAAAWRRSAAPRPTAEADAPATADDARNEPAEVDEPAGDSSEAAAEARASAEAAEVRGAPADELRAEAWREPPRRQRRSRTRPKPAEDDGRRKRHRRRDRRRRGTD